MSKSKSKAQRWMDATNALRIALDEGKSKLEDLQSQIQESLEGPLNDLRELKDEAETWFGNMPESLQGSATGERLQEIIDLDLPESVDMDALDELEEAIGNAEGLDFPRGYGRD